MVLIVGDLENTVIKIQGGGGRCRARVGKVAVEER